MRFPITFMLTWTMLRSGATAFHTRSLLRQHDVGIPRRWAFSSVSSSSRPASDKDDNDNANFRVNRRHTVTWKTSDDDIVFEVLDGELLRTAALRRGVASPHNGRANLINCRGLGTCGTCAVALEATTDRHLPPLNAVESVRLAVPPGHGADNTGRLRLACQIPVRGDVTLRKFNGFWGQSDQLISPTVPTTPLRAAEYVLDRTSPSYEKTEVTTTTTTRDDS